MFNVSIKENLGKTKRRQEEELENIKFAMEKIQNSYENLKLVTRDIDIIDGDLLKAHITLMSELEQAVFDGDFIKIPLTENTKEWLKDELKKKKND